MEMETVLSNGLQTDMGTDSWRSSIPIPTRESYRNAAPGKRPFTSVLM